MNRFSRLVGSAVIGLAGIAATATAGGPAGAHGGFRGHGMWQFDKCLSSVGLSAEQQANIDSIKTNARATFQADFAALKDAREKMKSDLSNGADKSVLGQNALDQDAAESKLKNDHKATHDQILAQLRPDQQSALESCMAQSHGRDGASLSHQPQESGQ